MGSLYCRFFLFLGLIGFSSAFVTTNVRSLNSKSFDHAVSPSFPHKGHNKVSATGAISMNFQAKLGKKMLIAKKLLKQTVKKKVGRNPPIPGAEEVQQAAAQQASSHVHNHAHSHAGHSHAHSHAAAVAKKPSLFTLMGLAFLMSIVVYKAVEAYQAKCTVLVQQYGMEAVQYEDNLDLIEKCTKNYKKKLGPIFHRERMFVEYVSNLIQEKTLSAETILAYQVVSNLFGYKEKKLAKLSLLAAGNNFPNDTGRLQLLYMVMERTLTSQEALEMIRPLRFQLASKYGEKNEGLIQFQSVTTAMVESAYTEKVSLLGDDILDMEKPGDWMALGMDEADADRIFDSACSKRMAVLAAEAEEDLAELQQLALEDYADAVRWQELYAVPDADKQEMGRREPELPHLEEQIKPLVNEEVLLLKQQKTEPEKETTQMSFKDRQASESQVSSIEERRKNVDVEELSDEDIKVEMYIHKLSEESESAENEVVATPPAAVAAAPVAPPAAAPVASTGTANTYECSNCGYMLFVAEGRDHKFFGEGFSCPSCGAEKNEFTKVERS